MSEVIWYRSLYWRIALGFVALVAALLAAQGLVFLWMTGRMTDVFPSRSPAQLASSIASETGAVLAQQPDIDLRAHLNRTYPSTYRGYVVVLADGQAIVSERVPPPPPLLRSAWGRLLAERGEALEGFPGVPGPPPPPSFDGRRENGRRGAPPGMREGMEGPPGRGRISRDGGPPGDDMFGGIEYARVLKDGEVVGMVAVPRGAPPMSLVLQALGPILAAVAFGLLVVGTAVAALVIFRPARHRLSQLQRAARAIGAGQTGVRAPVHGGDEVTSLSRAFNEMAEQLEQRTAALAAADRARRQLLADVSHELMTPLAAIRGYVETLQMTDVRIDETARARYLGIVNDESERLEQIIGDLLELARLEGGGGGLRDEDVSIAHLFERVRQRHDPVLADRHVTLLTFEDPAVGNIRGDRNRLEQALQNLAANAIRHTPSGGHVSIAARRDGDDVVISVKDTGPGISDEHLPRIFDRFYKIDESRTGTEVPSGSGLGLSIVQAIVVRHGGTVQASNVPTGGARFEIRLPAPSQRTTAIE